jgi:hypothetical protein
MDLMTMIAIMAKVTMIMMFVTKNNYDDNQATLSLMPQATVRCA